MKSVHKILNKNKFPPFKVSLLHEINEDNFERRSEFCYDMMARIDKNPNYHFDIVFSDEAKFKLKGTLNITANIEIMKIQLEARRQQAKSQEAKYLGWNIKRSNNWSILY